MPVEPGLPGSPGLPGGPFDVTAVEREIAGTRFAGHVHHAVEVDSTNDQALGAAAAGQENGVWIADAQTAGRGRGGHSWHSAPGDGLYTSLLVSPRLPLAQARLIPLITGLAVQAAVREVTGLTLDLRWPNDLMFAELKCGGILVESAGKPVSAASPPAQGAALRFAVIGIGLNVNHAAFPPELARLATSLALESSRQFAREPLLAAILRHAETELHILEGDFAGAAGPASQLTRFAAASTWVSGKRVHVGADQAGDGGYTGTTRGLDADGFLQVETDTGELRLVLSGGVRTAR